MIELLTTILVIHMVCNGISKETLRHIVLTIIFFLIVLFLKYLFFKLMTQ